MLVRLDDIDIVRIRKRGLELFKRFDMKGRVAIEVNGGERDGKQSGPLRAEVGARVDLWVIGGVVSGIISHGEGKPGDAWGRRRGENIKWEKVYLRVASETVFNSPWSNLGAVNISSPQCW